MEHIAALLLIVGCSPDLAECRELPAPVPVFETVEECREELPAALRTLRRYDPRVVGTCVDVDPALEEEAAEVVWEVSPAGVLTAEIVTDAVVARDDATASGEGLF